ncbi:uncharacterized protein N7479_003083, partial [Penicillium vulpinum]|uniref:uncharacterized protein n=1 Tax=Penicillium vulpinum TaxID=29845 RepID=UPI002547717A
YILYAVAYYGHFLQDIPRRLGNSTVLDSAVRALSTAYPFLHTGIYPPNVLVRYGKSLRDLRECLNNPVEARTPNTLCAVYLTTICQPDLIELFNPPNANSIKQELISWLGKHDNSLTNHSEAIAHILRAAALNEWKGTSEMAMVTTLCVPIGIFDRRIKMDSEFWELISSFKPGLSALRANNQLQSTIELQHLAMFPQFVKSPELQHAKIAKTYIQLRLDGQQIRPHLDKCPETILVLISSSEAVRHSPHAILSTLAVLMNSLLQNFDTWNASLVGEAVLLFDDITIQAELASLVAWATSDNLVQLARIEAVLSEYQSDFADVPWMSRATWLVSTLDSHRIRVRAWKEHPQFP